MAEAWLGALQVAQVAAARLTAELEVIGNNLEFWAHRMKQRRQFWFSLMQTVRRHAARRPARPLRPAPSPPAPAAPAVQH